MNSCWQWMELEENAGFASAARRLGARGAANVASHCLSRPLILTIRDTTSQKQADEEREASRHMVALAEMATLLAHEIEILWEALSCLPACSQRNAGLTDDSQKWVQHLQAGVRSSAYTVNNVLRFHTPGSAPLGVSELRDLGEWGRVCFGGGRPGLRSNWKRRLERSNSMCDAGSLRRVSLNLAHNALRHTPAGGTLRVRASWMSALSGDSLSSRFRTQAVEPAPEIVPRRFKGRVRCRTGRVRGGTQVCERIMAQHHTEFQRRAVQNEGSDCI